VADTLTTPAPAAPSAPARSRARRRSGSRLRTWGLRGIGVLLLLVSWQLLPTFNLLVDNRFVPPMSDVAVAWWEMLLSGQLGYDVQSSLIRSFAGLGIACVIAIPLGLVIGTYRTAAEVVSPVVELCRNTAALALIPVFTLVLGIGQTSKIALIAWTCIWPLLLSTQSGVRNVDPLLVRAARSMGVTRMDLYRKVVLRSALPSIFTGLRLSGAASVLMLVASELYGATSGLGYLIQTSQANMQIPEMYAGIITISVIGLLLNEVLVQLERAFSSWKEQ
jgi:NitT/TauT family transport system permease protein